MLSEYIPQPVLDALASIVVSVLTALASYASYAIVQFIRASLKKYKLDVSAEQDAQLELYVRMGIQRAAEEAARRVKAAALQGGHLTVSPEQKREIALQTVNELDPKADLARAETMLQSVLPTTTEGAANVGKAPGTPGQ